MAGQSARTRRANAEQLLHSAKPFEQDAKDAEGADSSTRVLGALSSDGWRVFHEVGWPGRSHAIIDHVLVGPGGVFVIDTLTWVGRVEVRGGSLRLDGRRRARHVSASAASAMAIAELLPGIDHKVVHPVICFARDERVFGWAGDVMIASLDNVVTFLTSRPGVLGEAQMSAVAEALATSLEAASSPVAPPVTAFSSHERRVVATRASARWRRLPRAPLPQPVRFVAGIGAAAVFAALVFRLDLPARIADLGSSAAQRVLAPTEPIGTTVSVPGLGSRPSLEVTAGAPVLTRSKVASVRPLWGHQLVAVPVAVHNTGDKVWTSHYDLSTVVTDSTGASYSSDPAYTSVRGGKALASTLELPANKSTKGVVVFEVPRGTDVEKVRMRVGPGIPTTLRWSVD